MYPGRCICGARPPCDKADTGTARHLADRLRHDCSGTLVTADSEFDVAIMESIERGKIAFARHTKNVTHTLDRQLIDQDFAACTCVVLAAHRSYFTIFAGGIFGANGAGVINQLACSITLPAFAFSDRKCFQSGSCIILARFCSRSPALS